MAKKIKFTDKDDNVKLTGGNDGTETKPINAKGGDDTVKGLGGDDVIDGAGGNDKLIGGAGNDTLISKAGNDTLNGGADTDKAVIAGNFADAVVTESGDTATIVINGRTITAIGIETFKFDDKEVSAADLVNDAPTGTSTAVLAAGTEDTAYVVKASDLLTGFTDPNGDTLSIANLTASDGATVKDNGDGTFTITPAANDNGDVTLTFDVTDGKLSVAGTNKVNFAAVDDVIALTKDTDTPALTADGDIVTGAVSALSTENTLNALDVIVDTGGTDTLKVDLKADFGGFTGTGKMTGVENIQLSNTGGVARTFTATGITGDKAYSLTGAVNLAGLTSISTVAAGARTADLSIGYTAATVAGAADTLALSVTGFGIADNPATTNINEQDDVKITAAGIETANLTVTGVNVLDLSGLAGKVNIAGAGTTTITKLSATTTSLDASTATGAMSVSTSGAVGVATLATGTGNDTITTNLSTELAANATVSGGTGTDTLVITGGAGGTVQLAQSGIETLGFGNVGGAVTMSLKNTTGLNSVVAYGDGNADGALAQDVVLANVGASTLALNLQGANAAAAGVKSITSDGTGSAVITVDTPAAAATDAAPSVNAYDVVLTAASSLDLTVASKMAYSGQITATKATSVNVNLQGAAAAGSAITAGSATSVIISAVNAASDLDITAVKATSLDITAAKNLTLTGATDFSSLESLKSTGAGNLDMTGIDLSKLNTATISNSGIVTLADLGSTKLGYGVSLNATGSKQLTVSDVATLDQAINITADSLGAIQFGTVNADDLGSVNIKATTNSGLTIGDVTGNNVTIDAGGVLGTVNSAIVNAYGNVTLVGSNLAANDYDTGADQINLLGATNQTVSITGGIKADLYEIVAGATNTGVTLTGNLDVGTDVVKVTGSSLASTISVAGLLNYETSTLNGGALADTINGGAGVDTITGGAGSNTITTGAGADTYVENYAGGTLDTISDFTAGAGGDEIDISLAALETAGTSGINAAVSNFTKLNSAANGADAAAGDVTIQELNADGVAGSVNAANADLFIFTGATFASTDAVETALEAGGDTALAINVGDDVVGSAFMIVYSDGTNAYLASVRVDAVTAADADFESGNLTVTKVANLGANPSITAAEFTAANFDWVA
jgi:hypothetical protein